MPLYVREAPDDGQKDCPKHVELLLPIIKLDLSASVGFIHKKCREFHKISYFSVSFISAIPSSKFVTLFHVCTLEITLLKPHGPEVPTTCPRSSLLNLVINEYALKGPKIFLIGTLPVFLFHVLHSSV